MGTHALGWGATLLQGGPQGGSSSKKTPPDCVEGSVEIRIKMTLFKWELMRISTEVRILCVSLAGPRDTPLSGDPAIGQVWGGHRPLGAA